MKKSGRLGRLTFMVALICALFTSAACGGTTAGTAMLPGADAGSDPDVGLPDEEEFGEGAAGGARPGFDVAGTFDVCAMLSDEEMMEAAAAVNPDHSWTSLQLEREKKEYTAEQQSLRPKSSCRFVVNDQDGYNFGVIQVTIQPGDGYEGIYKPGGEPIPDLGDDAVNNAGTVYVLVGDLMLTIEENTFTSDMSIEVLRRVVPDVG